MQEGADGPRAAAAAALLGHHDPVVRPLRELATAVQVVPLVDRRIQDLCGGPVERGDWRTRLDEARELLQLLDLDGALSAFSLLEAELPCLTAVLAPGDAFHFHLSLTELHLVAARSSAGDPVRGAFHEQEALRAAARAAGAGPTTPLPADTLAEARDAIARARSEAAGQAPARVAVAGPHEQVWWDGNPASRLPFDLPAGDHVLQLTADLRDPTVVAVARVELAPGEAAVVWARPGGAPLDTATIDDDVYTLVHEGRAPVGLAPTLRALSASGPSYVVSGDAEQVRLWGADGDAVRLRIVDPPGPAAAPGASQRGPGGGDYAVQLGAHAGVYADAAVEPGGGVGVAGRVGLHRVVVVTLGGGVGALGLPGEEGWPGRGLVQAQAGLRGRLASQLLDLGVEGGIALPVGQELDSTAPLPTVRGIGGLRLPPSSPAGLRIEAWGGLLGLTGWQLGGGLAVELARAPG